MSCRYASKSSDGCLPRDHGRRILKCWYTKDLREVVKVPASDSSSHGDAVFVFLLFQQAQAEAFQPRKIIGRVAITNA